MNLTESLKIMLENGFSFSDIIRDLASIAGDWSDSDDGQTKLEPYVNADRVLTRAWLDLKGV